MAAELAAKAGAMGSISHRSRAIAPQATKVRSWFSIIKDERIRDRLIIGRGDPRGGGGLRMPQGDRPRERPDALGGAIDPKLQEYCEL
ncbi:MAG: hypothetical protein Fur0042_13630 [Cyanophyceae cyanobacterium]